MYCAPTNDLFNRITWAGGGSMRSPSRCTMKLRLAWGREPKSTPKDHAKQQRCKRRDGKIVIGGSSQPATNLRRRPRFDQVCDQGLHQRRDVVCLQVSFRVQPFGGVALHRSFCLPLRASGAGAAFESFESFECGEKKKKSSVRIEPAPKKSLYMF